jgi:hypothetical protein
MAEDKLAGLRLYDNTRISDFRRCPRYFYFRHERNWTTPGASAPLIFGSAWHDAMDYVWPMIHTHKYGAHDIVEKAHAAFMRRWKKDGMPTDIDIELSKELSPRLPAVAKEMLISYVHKRTESILGMELIETERRFAVPLSLSDPTVFYVGRIDKVVRPDNRSIRGIEHKTTTASKIGPDKEPRINGKFLETFSPNSQVDGYDFTLNMLYPTAENIDIWVDAALVHGRGEDFKFIPVDRTMDQLNAWVWETTYWIQQIEFNRQLALQSNAGDPFMRAFAKDTGRCFDFNTTCPFLPLCKSRPNPMTWDDAPQPYVVRKWDPLDHIGGTPDELK